MQNVQVSASIQSVETKVDLVKKDMESVNDHINRFKLFFEELFKRPNIPSEFNSFKSYIEDFINDAGNKHTASISNMTAIRSTLENVKNTISHHENLIRMAHQSLPILDEKIDKTKEDLSTKIVSISTAFSNRFDAHADLQKKQLETFSAQAMTAPNSVIESNRKLVEKIDLAIAESANAYLKSSNIETTVKILERKVENLGLQIKKLENSLSE